MEWGRIEDLVTPWGWWEEGGRGRYWLEPPLKSFQVFPSRRSPLSSDGYSRLAVLIRYLKTLSIDRKV